MPFSNAMVLSKSANAVAKSRCNWRQVGARRRYLFRITPNSAQEPFGRIIRQGLCTGRTCGAGHRSPDPASVRRSPTLAGPPGGILHECDSTFLPETDLRTCVHRAADENAANVIDRTVAGDFSGGATLGPAARSSWLPNESMNDRR